MRIAIQEAIRNGDSKIPYKDERMTKLILEGVHKVGLERQGHGKDA